MLIKGTDSELLLDGRTLIMGILNVTPDSFSDGAAYSGPIDAVERALEMVKEGADIIDVGGESTRPGALPVAEAEELKRVLPVVEALASKGVRVSVDTTKARVARKVIDAGAWMINDVSAMTADPDMIGVVRDSGAAVALMHMRGTPATMQQETNYTDVVGEVTSYLARRLRAAVEAGIEPERTVIDPGLGFGKSVEGNLELVKGIPSLKALERPVLVGPSRKSFISAVLGLGDDTAARLAGTLAVIVASVLGGADMIRVHDVKQAREAARMAELLV